MRQVVKRVRTDTRTEIYGGQNNTISPGKKQTTRIKTKTTRERKEYVEILGCQDVNLLEKNKTQLFEWYKEHNAQQTDSVKLGMDRAISQIRETKKTIKQMLDTHAIKKSKSTRASRSKGQKTKKLKGEQRRDSVQLSIGSQLSKSTNGGDDRPTAEQVEVLAIMDKQPSEASRHQ